MTVAGRPVEYVLLATSMTGLVGGVFAAAVGATPRRGARGAAIGDEPEPWRVRLAVAYVSVYALAGAGAVVVCLTRLGSATPLLQSLAGAFLGASAAAASSFFGLGGRRGGDDSVC